MSRPTLPLRKTTQKSQQSRTTLCKKSKQKSKTTQHMRTSNEHISHADYCKTSLWSKFRFGRHGNRVFDVLVNWQVAPLVRFAIINMVWALKGPMRIIVIRLSSDQLSKTSLCRHTKTVRASESYVSTRKAIFTRSAIDICFNQIQCATQVTITHKFKSRSYSTADMHQWHAWIIINKCPHTACRLTIPVTCFRT